MNNNWVDIGIERGPVYGNLKNRVGLRLRITANPELEQFMRNLSNGKTIPMDSLTADWIRIPQENTEIYAINFGRTPKEYTLSAVGMPPIFEAANAGEGDAPIPARLRTTSQKDEIANLSFLTIAGISREEGVTIGMSGVYSFDYIQSARTKLINAAKQFLHDYIVPVTINLQITQRM